MKRQVSSGCAYIHATYNNTIVTLTDTDGNVLAWSTAGHCGFRGPKKATPYAASVIVKNVAEKVAEYGLKDVNVYVKGVGLSMGDLHFSQGDGEITFCGAIEMAGWIHIRVNVIKGGIAKYGVKNPIFKPSPLQPEYKRHLIFEGISVDEGGKQHYLDAHVSYRQACLNAIEYLKKFGYTGSQAYAILGTAPVQGHISGIVDIPNVCATLFLPTEIFDFDINPCAEGPTKFVGSDVDIPISYWSDK